MRRRPDRPSKRSPAAHAMPRSPRSARAAVARTRTARKAAGAQAAKPAGKPVAKPAVKAAAKPAARLAAKPAARLAGKPAATRSLARLRTRIDALDDEMLAILSRRASLAQEIVAVKARHGLPLYVPERERQVVARLRAANPGPLDGLSLETIVSEVMSACRALEGSLDVAYLGPEATFSHEATKRRFGSAVRLRPCLAIPDVFDDVERGRACYGVVPIENSTEGGVGATLDLLVTSPLGICGEIALSVRQHLLSRTAELGPVTKVYSHPQALAQCRGFLAHHLPHAALVEVPSTARAAQLAAEDSSAAAVAGEIAAKLFGLTIAVRDIQDLAYNVTRFVIIGRDAPRPTGHDRTSVVFGLHDLPGILHDALSPFARARLNLTRIESRPSRRRAWEYHFFVDVDGHRDDPRLARALLGLEKACHFFKVLGSYPRD